MSDLLIHLTDAHVVETDSVVSSRAKLIAAAALSEVLDIDSIHLVFSGDMVQSGRQEEYEVLNSFVNELTTELSRLRSVPIYYINAPGNHDCDFRGDQTPREFVLRAMLNKPSQSINLLV